jgi:O-antigen/teichoic acid export membrane protein
MVFKSIKSRFAISLVANVLRGLLIFLTAIFLARLLGSADYGRIAFLFATFQAVRQLLDPGVSSAFYTFLSQKKRSARFMWSYEIFLLGKYLLTVGLVWFVMPEAWINYAWRGESRDLLVFALSAVLMQFEWWPSTMQLLESQRRTILAQSLYILLLALQLLGVYVLYWLDMLSIKSFMLMSAILWASGTLVSMLRYHFQLVAEPETQEDPLLQNYIAYCLPMVSLGLLSFLVEFSDRWFLQAFAGSHEQGYFSVSQQIAAVTLMITASMVRVLWKEIAEALHYKNIQQAWTLYTKAKKGLFFVSAMIATGLGPWSEKIITLFFGSAYTMAAPVFMVLIFAATYQTLGQIEGTLLMASGKTGTGMLFNIFMAPLGIGLSFILIAGATGLGISALTPLGALGLAVKVLAVQIFTVNVLGYLLCKKMIWRFEWVYQLKILALLTPLGFLTKIFFSKIFDVTIFTIMTAGIFYMMIVGALVMKFPKLLDVGFDIRRICVPS